MSQMPMRPRMPTPEDEERAQRGLNRLAILDDDYDEMAKRYVESRYASPELAAAIGEPDTTANLAASLCRQLTTPGLYGIRPKITGPEGSAPLIGVDGYLEQAGWLRRMPRVQYLALGLGDVFIRWDAPPGSSTLTTRIVYPFDVYLEAPPDQPDRPYLLMERRPRWIPSLDDPTRNEWVWCWDVYDVRPERPRYAVVRCQATGDTAQAIGAATVGRDESWLLGREAAGGLVGDQYPFRRADRTPRLPWSHYRWSDAGTTWNDMSMRAAHKATLSSMFLWTLTVHSAKSAAMGKFVIAHNMMLPSDQVGRGASSVRTIPVLPGTIVPTTPVDNTQPAQVIEVGPSGDVVPLLNTATGYELMGAMRFGLAPGDLGRQANPTSAAALAISAEGRRAAAAQCEEVFRAEDLEAIACAADVLRSADVADLPSAGYTIAYHRIARTPAEDQAEREEIDWAVAKGQMGPIEAYQRRHPGVDAESARRALIAARKEAIEIEQAAATLQTGGAGAGGKAADTALNGAQVASLLQIVQAVATRQLPRESAVAMIQAAFNVDEPAATAMLGPVGTTFFAEPAPSSAPQRPSSSAASDPADPTDSTDSMVDPADPSDPNEPQE